MTQDYTLPPLPLGGEQVTVMRWLRQHGEPIEQGEPLLIVLNARVEVLLPAPQSGILEQALVAEGETATVGVALARIASVAPVAEAAAPAASPQPALRLRISPVARRIAAAIGIDLAHLAGSGPGGRVMKRDVLPEERPSTTDHQGTTTDDRPPTTSDQRPASEDRVVQVSARPIAPGNGQVVAAETRVAAVTTHAFPLGQARALTAMEVDLSQVAAQRERHQAAFARRGIDLSYTACVALAAVTALLRHPLLNSTWTDEYIIMRRRVQLQVAQPGATGLSLTVVPDAQDLNLRGIARAITKRSQLSDISATSSITVMSTLSTGNWWQSDALSAGTGPVLSLGTVAPRPVVISTNNSDRIVVRQTALLTLAYDSRVVNQLVADHFLTTVRTNLERFSSC